MKAKTAGIATGAALVGAGVLGSRTAKSKLHERCKAACAHMAGDGTGEGEARHGCRGPSAESEARHGSPGPSQAGCGE